MIPTLRYGIYLRTEIEAAYDPAYWKHPVKEGVLISHRMDVVHFRGGPTAMRRLCAASICLASRPFYYYGHKMLIGCMGSIKVKQLAHC